MAGDDEFNQTVDKILSRFDQRPSDLVDQLRRFRDEARASGSSGDVDSQPRIMSLPESIQVNVLSAIVQASKDMNNLELLWGDTSPVFSSEHLEKQSVSIALINRSRKDIQLAEDGSGDKLRTRAFSWKKTHLTNTTIENARVDEGFKYDPVAWSTEILAGLRECVAAGANIISFGEFDYPPRFSRDYTERKFRRELLKEIDASKEPIVLFAGSRHERRRSHDHGEREFHADNVGHVFLNKAILRTQGPIGGVRELRIYKRTPASKVGEQLSRRYGISMQGYRTVLGRICFLICADAYDPTVALEFFAKSANPTLKPEIILVPSYNVSPRLANMCEVLSLITNSVVILIDVCAEARRGHEKDAIGIWNCGVPANKENGLTFAREVPLAQDGVIQFWLLEWPQVREFQTLYPAQGVIPLFDEARKKVQALRQATA